MPHLSLSLLGPLQVMLDAQPVEGFKSHKVRALLAYLAAEAERPHRREALAELLWPERPNRDALSNLRYALSNLRQVIGDRTTQPPFLLITRDSLQFNQASDYSLDVADFVELLKTDKIQDSAVDRLERAVALYRGNLLEGFSVDDSPAFEEWALFARERLARQMSSALHRLLATYEQRGEYDKALSYAWRLVELEPWAEAAHQQLMRVLALSGQRSAALAQYETCRRLLAQELDVEPATETTRLYEQIRDGELKPSAPLPPRPTAVATQLPAFLHEEEPVEVETPVFVAREPELAKLDRFLELALAGQGRVVFVTGEAGSGKTALIQEFARRAQEAYADPSTESGQTLIVAGGNCNAYTGVGDPYLPFREILELLTGEVEAKWAAGAITRAHALRLWNVLPHTVQALLDTGPDLIDTFVPRVPLLERATAHARASGGEDWLTRLNEHLERKPLTGGTSGQQQTHLFKQYTALLTTLARQSPLVLTVDDLQWADSGSIDLLFHLGRNLGRSPILIVGAFRAEEVASGRNGARHPLETVVNELRQAFGDILVNVDRAERLDFVAAFLNSEPNRLGVPFREMLCRRTHGHPLFTIELLRGMQERGDLVLDSQDRWVEGPALDWETLPARVEAAIAERIERLPQPLQRALQVASVEGEDFTAEVVAKVVGAKERQTVQRLSGALDRQHRLVRAQEIERVGPQRVSRYRFRNYLFQKYLYDSLDEVERSYLHEDVGSALEELYKGKAGRTVTIAPQLARHYQEAGMAEKAIHYLHQAGERAVQLSAFAEGLAHLTRALDLFTALPEPAGEEDGIGRDRQELALQLSLGLAWVGSSAYGPSGEAAYARARELCLQLGETSQLCMVLGRLSTFHYLHADHERARELGQEALRLAQEADDPLHVALGHRYLGVNWFPQGEYTKARTHFAEMISFYEPQQHHPAFVSIRGSDAGTSALAYDACCLWCLGYPDQAAQRSQEVLALAREQGPPFSLCEALCFAGGYLSEMRREPQALLEYGDELTRLADEKVPGFAAAGPQLKGEALTMLGRTQEGMALLREAMALEQSGGVHAYVPVVLQFLGEAQAKAGQPEQGLATLSQALALVEETGGRHWEAEIHRTRADLLLMRGHQTEAETSLRRAIDVARRQEAKSWELRATIALARLWQEQGRTDEAREMLAKVYGWFTEGFNTTDLKEAKALLEELSS